MGAETRMLLNKQATVACSQTAFAHTITALLHACNELRAWNRDTDSSFRPLGNCARSTHEPRLLCHTRRRPECLDR